jgi:glutamate racemase
MTLHQVLAQALFRMELNLFHRLVRIPIVEIVDPAAKAAVDVSHNLVQRYGVLIVSEVVSTMAIPRSSALRLHEQSRVLSLVRGYVVPRTQTVL